MKRRYKKRNNFIFLRIIIILAILIVLSILIFEYIDTKIKPTLISVSEARARVIATQAVNNAINEKIAKDVDYTKLVSIRTDKNGKITMVQANTMEMNRIAAGTALAVQEKMREIGNKSVQVPLGVIFGSQIFANAGPKINVGILPVGTVDVDFDTQFDRAGINQIRHKMYIIVKARVKVVAPLVSNTIEVVSHVPITEIVVVGDVPQSYVDVNPNDRDMVGNIIANKAQ